VTTFRPDRWADAADPAVTNRGVNITPDRDPLIKKTTCAGVTLPAAPFPGNVVVSARRISDGRRSEASHTGRSRQRVWQAASNRNAAARQTVSAGNNQPAAVTTCGTTALRENNNRIQQMAGSLRPGAGPPAPQFVQMDIAHRSTEHSGVTTYINCLKCGVLDSQQDIFACLRNVIRAQLRQFVKANTAQSTIQTEDVEEFRERGSSTRRVHCGGSGVNPIRTRSDRARSSRRHDVVLVYH
jgi:hypothetical protein